MSLKVPESRKVTKNIPVDTKLCNWDVDIDGNVNILTIAGYLASMSGGQRVPEKYVTMLMSKTGAIPVNENLLISINQRLLSTILNDIEGKQYAFIGGLADENFIEIPGTASKIAIPFTNIDNPDIPDYSIYAAKYGQYPKMPQVDLYFINESGNPAKHTAQPEFILDVDNLIVSINFGTFSDPITGFMLLQ